MIIDMHTHIFPERIAAPTVAKLASVAHMTPFSDGTLEGLRAGMAGAGIDCSVVLPVATNPGQVAHVNDSSLQINDRGGETGVYSFGCMHPDFPDWKSELARLADRGVKGIKLHPVYQGTDLDDLRYLRILDRAGEVGLAVLAHAGLDIGYPTEVRCSPEHSLRAVRQVGPVKLILAHMGGWRNWDQVEELLTHTGVCLDTAFCLGSITPLDDHYAPEELPMMADGQFLRMVRTFGSRRVFFGTDSPWADQRESLALLRALPLTEGELTDILGGNAAELLGLSS